MEKSLFTFGNSSLGVIKQKLNSIKLLLLYSKNTLNFISWLHILCYIWSFLYFTKKKTNSRPHLVGSSWKWQFWKTIVKRNTLTCSKIDPSNTIYWVGVRGHEYSFLLGLPAFHFSFLPLSIWSSYFKRSTFNTNFSFINFARLDIVPHLHPTLPKNKFTQRMYYGIQFKRHFKTFLRQMNLSKLKLC